MFRQLYRLAGRTKYRTFRAVQQRWEDALITVAKRLPAQSAQGRLIILDDCFPHLLSSFRIAEYTKYLECFPDAEVLSTGTVFAAMPEKQSFRSVLHDYSQYHPGFEQRIHTFHPLRKVEPGLFYTVFLSNAYRFLRYIEHYNRPFVFTLYPGGGLKFGDPVSEQRLRRVLSSPNFARVIVTQKPVYTYLIEQDLCPQEKIEFIYGGVVPVTRLSENPPTKQLYPHDKSTFDLCFVAYKYMRHGIDKGYDRFIEVARELSKRYDNIHFHVVGPYTEADWETTGVKNLHFYGSRVTDFFPTFHAKMDIILSPNVSNVLAPGAFDGFPTGGCVEAGWCGVALFVTDDLGQNMVLEDGREIVIITREVAAICAQIEQYYRDPQSLYELAAAGQKKLRQVFDTDAQMARRLNILSAILSADLGA